MYGMMLNSLQHRSGVEKQHFQASHVNRGQLGKGGVIRGCGESEEGSRYRYESLRFEEWVSYVWEGGRDMGEAWESLADMFGRLGETCSEAVALQLGRGLW